MSRIVDSVQVMLELGLGTSATDEEQMIVQAAIRKAESAVRSFLKYDPVKTSRVEYYPRQDFTRTSGAQVWEANTSSAYVRQLSEASTDELQMKHLPIRTDVAIDLRIDYDGRFGAKSGAFASETQKIEGTDYWPDYDGVDNDSNSLCRDGIIRSVGLWPTEAGSVKVTYTAGYTSDEFNGTNSIVDAVPIWESVIDEAMRRAKKVLVQKKSSAAGWVAGPMVSESLGDYSYSVDSALATKLFGSSVDLTTETKEKLSAFVNWGISLGG